MPRNFTVPLYLEDIESQAYFTCNCLPQTDVAMSSERRKKYRKKKVHVTISHKNKERLQCFNNPPHYSPSPPPPLSVIETCPDEFILPASISSNISVPCDKVDYEPPPCHDLIQPCERGPHAFPFLGETPSGNLKIPQDMVSFENENLTIIVADNKKTKVKHKEWKEISQCKMQNHQNNNEPQTLQKLCDTKSLHSSKSGQDQCYHERRNENNAFHFQMEEKILHEIYNIQNMIKNLEKKLMHSSATQGKKKNHHSADQGLPPIIKHHSAISKRQASKDHHSVTQSQRQLPKDQGSVIQNQIPSDHNPADSSDTQRGPYSDTEEQRRQIEEQAATTIQRYARGYLVRKNLRKQNEAARKIQNAWKLFQRRRVDKY